MARRTGIPTTIFLARQLCTFVTRYDLVIRRVTNNNAAVIAALEAALASCALLASTLDDYLEQGV